MYICTQLPEDLNMLWAYITFYGGECQLNLNKKVTHLVVTEPKGVSVCSVLIFLLGTLVQENAMLIKCWHYSHT